MVRPLIIPGEAPLNIVEQVKIFVSLFLIFEKKTDGKILRLKVL